LANDPGTALRSQGEVKEMRESFGQFTAGFVIAAVLVYLVMVAQFRRPTGAAHRVLSHGIRAADVVVCTRVVPFWGSLWLGTSG
jgi:multidrug efflux pump subunit AcrB